MPKIILTVTSLKGGVGKSTSAIHLAQYFCRRGPTLLVDGDPNRSVLEWSQRGVSLPFTVITDRQLAREAGQYDIIIIDTKGRPEEDDLREMMNTPIWSLCLASPRPRPLVHSATCARNSRNSIPPSTASF